MDTKDLLTIPQASALTGITPQALYMAIYKQRLCGIKLGNQHFVTNESLAAYQHKRYCRAHSKMEDGELIFDPAKRIYSAKQAAKLLGIPQFRMYKLIAKGVLNATRYKSAHRIHIPDVHEAKAKARKFLKA